MTIEKTNHQIIVDVNQQANNLIQNNIDLVNEKIQSNYNFYFFDQIKFFLKSIIDLSFIIYIYIPNRSNRRNSEKRKKEVR